MHNPLESFIIAAKSACCVGSGAKAAASRLGSHDLTYCDGSISYRDGYFGGTDFVGQEVVWTSDVLVWAMNYSGRILRDDLLNADRAGAIIKAALSQMYATGRFPGGFERHDGEERYVDSSTGDFRAFAGMETIWQGRVKLYELAYHGGMIRT